MHAFLVRNRMERRQGFARKPDIASFDSGMNGGGEGEWRSIWRQCCLLVYNQRFQRDSNQGTPQKMKDEGVRLSYGIRHICHTQQKNFVMRSTCWAYKPVCTHTKLPPTIFLFCGFPAETKKSGWEKILL